MPTSGRSARLLPGVAFGSSYESPRVPLNGSSKGNMYIHIYTYVYIYIYVYMYMYADIGLDIHVDMDIDSDIAVSVKLEGGVVR